MFIGYYNYTVVLTYLGLSSAVVGMVEAMKHDYKTALICRLICGVCDMFDGMIARTSKKRSEDAKSFGVQIDSLCDVICFGVFPVVIGYSLCPMNWFTVLCSVFFVLAAVIRLAFFNVQEINRVENNEGKREYYLGLPVTASALIMPAVALVTSLNAVNWAYLYPVCLALTGIANITRFKVKKPYLAGLVFLLIIGALIFYLTFRFGGNITCMKPGISV